MTTSKLRINHTQSRRYRSVWHICWNDFDDQMCPKYVSGFLGEIYGLLLLCMYNIANVYLTRISEFLKEIGTIRIASTSEIPHGHNRNPPVLIHCRGGEKTGLVLVADLLLYTLDHNQVGIFPLFYAIHSLMFYFNLRILIYLASSAN